MGLRATRLPRRDSLRDGVAQAEGPGDELSTQGGFGPAGRGDLAGESQAAPEWRAVPLTDGNATVHGAVHAPCVCEWTTRGRRGSVKRNMNGLRLAQRDVSLSILERSLQVRRSMGGIALGQDQAGQRDAGAQPRPRLVENLKTPVPDLGGGVVDLVHGVAGSLVPQRRRQPYPVSAELSRSHALTEQPNLGVQVSLIGDTAQLLEAFVGHEDRVTRGSLAVEVLSG